MKHYSDDACQKKDTKCVKDPQDGSLPYIWYPRAGTLGGCTAHNAMITVVPHDSDWDHIAAVTGDPTWSADNMRRYFRRLRGDPQPDPIQDRPRYGFDDWLTTQTADFRLLLADDKLPKLVAAAAEEALKREIHDPLGFLRTLASDAEFWAQAEGDPTEVVRRHLDPNDAQVTKDSPEGLALIPMAIRQGQRIGPREYLLETQARHPDRLFIQTDALVTKVVLDHENTAIGVDYVSQAHVYRADPAVRKQPTVPLPPRRRVSVRREVIVAAGAFNSPQLLMLSGIGPREVLLNAKVEVRVELPGVGQNLQDRYEVGVVSDMANAFQSFRGATFSPDSEDPNYIAWQSRGEGIYASNGAVLGIMIRSSAARNLGLKDPDLFIFGLPANFYGYFPGYSKVLAAKPV